MATAGRKTKLTDEVCEAICKNIIEGNTVKYSVQKEGLDESTYYKWIKKGEEAKSGKFFQFVQSIKKAKEEAKSELVKDIKAHGKKNWQSLAWLLERMYPNEFGRRENVKMEHKGELKTQNTTTVLLETRLERLRRIENERNKENDTPTDL